MKQWTCIAGAEHCQLRSIAGARAASRQRSSAIAPNEPDDACLVASIQVITLNGSVTCNVLTHRPHRCRASLRPHVCAIDSVSLASSQKAVWCRLGRVLGPFGRSGRRLSAPTDCLPRWLSTSALVRPDAGADGGREVGRRGGVCFNRQKHSVNSRRVQSAKQGAVWQASRTHGCWLLRLRLPAKAERQPAERRLRPSWPSLCRGAP